MTEQHVSNKHVGKGQQHLVHNSFPDTQRRAGATSQPLPGPTWLRMMEATSGTRVACSVSRPPRNLRPSGRFRNPGQMAACTHQRNER
jgi:hypothetical protein